MRNVLSLLIFLSLITACQREKGLSNKAVLAEAGGQYLYIDDALSFMPSGLKGADSLSFLEDYAKKWAEDALFYDQAEHHISDNDEIEKLVSNYRKALITHSYQQSLVAEKLSGEIREQELIDYFSQNEVLFKLDYPLIKGLFIKVPRTAPELEHLRKWYKSDDQEDVDRLEKYSIQHAVTYEYFYDHWCPLSDLAEQIPFDTDNVDSYVAEHRSIEIKTEEYYYFLHVRDYRQKGETMPYEYARSQVKDMVLNKRQTDFIRSVREELYNRALKGNRVKINVETKNEK